MPGILNTAVPLPHAGAAAAIPELSAEDSELPFPALQPPAGIARARGLSKTASQPIASVYGRPTLLQAELFCKPRNLDNRGILVRPEREVSDYGSSGSEHDPSSVCLFAMVNEFIENNGAGEHNVGNSYRPGSLTINKENQKANGAVEMPQNLQSLALCADVTEETLLRDTKHILDSVLMDASRYLCDGKPATTAHSCLKRIVMSRLQKMGYIAAVCKTRWDHLCGIPAGDYEFIDVLISNGAPSKAPERLIVDIDFQGQFEIARPTDNFTKILHLLPPFFVGRPARLKQIIHVMSEATKQSLRGRGLHLPPWRKLAYMKAKWFSSYRRTSNITSGYPCREGDQRCNGAGFAVRGGGLDVRYTSTLEMLYHGTGSKLFNGGNDVGVCRRREDEITVTMTDWRPPAIIPRYTGPRNQGVMGLTSLMSHAPPFQSNEGIVQAV